MKKKIFLCMICVLSIFLCACTKTEEKTQSENLEFPELTWDMTPEDVLKVFQTEKENTIFYNESNLTTSFGITDINVFGQQTERVLFSFVDFASLSKMPGLKAGKQRLCRIMAYYPQDADLTPVKKNLKQAYGATISEYYPFSSKMISENDWSMRLEPLKESESLQYWGGNMLTDVLSEDDLKACQAYWKNCRHGLNDENWNFFKDHARMVSVIFSDQESEEGKGVEWDAHNFAVYQVLKKGNSAENNQ